MTYQTAIVAGGTAVGAIAGAAGAAYVGLPPEIGVIAGGELGGQLANWGVNKYNKHHEKKEQQNNQKKHKKH